MPRYLEIAEDLIVNVVEASPAVAEERGWEPAPEGVGIGHAVVGSGKTRRFVAPPAPPVSLDDIRRERDRLLRASDWTQLADAPLADAERAAWREYRRALRELPQTVDEGATEMAWPQPPSETGS